MNNGISATIGLVVGGAVGFFASRQYFMTKYRQIADEEIASVKEALKRERPPVKKKAEKKASPIKQKETLKTDYTKYRTQSTTIKDGEEPIDVKKEPYVIPPEMFGEDEDYETISLTYYADEVLADDDGNAMTLSEVNDAVGAESLEHFGEYENDCVYVRNEDRKCDYEVILDKRTYQEMRDDKAF